MADEDKKGAQDPKDAEETKDQEAPVESKQEEKPADSSSEASAKKEEPKEEAPKDVGDTEETKDQEDSDVGAQHVEPEQKNSADKEPPSPISEEMQDTSGHKGKMIGSEEVKSGMTVRVHERILDISPKGEERERIQVFEGIVLGVKGAGNKRTITVRKVSGGIGVEKVFPLSSPNVTKIEVVKVARVRQAKLGFLRNVKRRFKRKLKETWMK